MTIFFQSHQIAIYRKRRIGNTNRFGISATFTSYNADIQPADQERVQMDDGRWGKYYVAFIDANIEIKENDQVRVTGGTYANQTFGVRGVSKWEGAGLLDHVELILVAQD